MINKMHTHTENKVDTDNVIAFPNDKLIESGPSEEAKHEARLAGAAISAGAGLVGLLVVASDLLNNRVPSEVIAPVVGTSILLGASYYLQPYLSQTRIGKRVEAWAAPRRELQDQKLKVSIENKKRELDSRDLKRKIKQSSEVHKLHDNKVKLFY